VLEEGGASAYAGGGVTPGRSPRSTVYPVGTTLGRDGPSRLRVGRPKARSDATASARVATWRTNRRTSEARRRGNEPGRGEHTQKRKRRQPSTDGSTPRRRSSATPARRGGARARRDRQRLQPAAATSGWRRAGPGRPPSRIAAFRFRWACAGRLGADELGHAARPTAVPAPPRRRRLERAPGPGVCVCCLSTAVPPLLLGRGRARLPSSAAVMRVWAAGRGPTRGRPDGVHTTVSWGVKSCPPPPGLVSATRADRGGGGLRRFFQTSVRATAGVAMCITVGDMTERGGAHWRPTAGPALGWSTTDDSSAGLGGLDNMARNARTADFVVAAVSAVSEVEPSPLGATMTSCIPGQLHKPTKYEEESRDCLPCEARLARRPRQTAPTGRTSCATAHHRTGCG